MVDALLRYVSDQLRKGYSADQIKAVLLRQGYSPAIVDGVMESAMLSQRGAPSPGVPAATSAPGSKLPLIIAGVVVVGLIALGVVFVPKLFSGGALLDVMASPDSDTYSPGDEVGFDLEIFNMGSKDRFDITLTYRVFDDSENLITSYEETVAISTSTSYHKGVTLPNSMQPGKYEMKVFADYDEKLATTAFTFDVAPKEVVTPERRESCFDGLQNQDEEHVDCGGKCGGYWYDDKCNSIPEDEKEARDRPAEPTCSDGLQNQDETGTDCGGRCGGYWYDAECHTAPKPGAPATSSTPSTGSTQATRPTAVAMEMRVLAATNPEAAKNGCLGITEETVRDGCIRSVAQISKNNGYCELIYKDEDRDLCYYPFFMQGDYSVCEKLVTKESLQTCIQMQQLTTVTIPTIKAQVNTTG